ncbi:hypothetical protein HYS97_01130 [Candidatus Daviesbacteria bacterium]|nr:hypothetical protein [Candidatus Daviesbacteria bacterium]
MRKKRFLGFGFTDEIDKVKVKAGHFRKIAITDWQENLIPNFNPEIEEIEDKNSWGSMVFLSICLLAFFTLFLRLFHLQVAEGVQNRELADGNRIQVRVIHAPRGVIYDRNGKILASNSPGFRLFDPETQRVKILNREQALELEVKNDPRAKNLEVDNLRNYPLKEVTAHVVGLLGEISQEDLKNDNFKNHKSGDWIGRGGIELQYENILKGVDGGEIIEVDSKGNKIRTLRVIDPVSGKNVFLTIDADLQKLIYEKLKVELEKVSSCCGSAVAEDRTATSGRR